MLIITSKVVGSVPTMAQGKKK